MLNVNRFIVNPVQENCFIASDDSGEGVIIDCGCFDTTEWEEIKKYIEQNNITIKHLLNTHLHFDHVLGNRFVHTDLGLTAKCHEGDLAIYEKMEEQLRLFFGNAFNGISMPSIDTSLNSNDLIKFGKHTLQVIHTPGHSAGGLCFYCEEEKTLWVGDTLFNGSIGRTDLEGGDYNTLIRSITDNLLVLPEDVVVHPGHGASTTICNEKRFNPFL